MAGPVSLVALLVCVQVGEVVAVRAPVPEGVAEFPAPAVHLERSDDQPSPQLAPGGRLTQPAQVWVRNGYESVQVNVDAAGRDIIGDAANEPSIAVDPTNLNRLVIGWRQFDNIASNFRQAGWAYSHDAGQTWTFPGTLEPGVFRSDPVLDADADGNIYYLSLMSDLTCQLFKSRDGGVTWQSPVEAFGGDKEWFTIDRSEGPGRGNIYEYWNTGGPICGKFARSFDGGTTFVDCSPLIVRPVHGTMAVGPDGELYIGGGEGQVVGSTTIHDPALPPQFELSVDVPLGLPPLGGASGPNPGGLTGQAWIAVDHSDGMTRGNVYLLKSVRRLGSADPADVMFARSEDGGLTWRVPVRVNDDAQGNNAWQWFATMSVSPTGRIDVVWNDTRNDPGGVVSELYYAYSLNAGESWSENIAVSPPFDPHIGWPNQNKIGDYYDMVSDEWGANVAYAATFNGGEDVYYLRIGTRDCNQNSVADARDIAAGTSVDGDMNSVPDECQTVYFVNSNAARSGDGSSWASAFADLDQALEVARPPDMIWVAEGTYIPTVRTDPEDPRSAAFSLRSGVGVYGGFAGDEATLPERNPSAYPTILSGDVNGDDISGYLDCSDNVYHVVTAMDTTATTVLDGLLIRAGCADGDDLAVQSGAGLLVSSGDVTVRGCEFEGNTASGGGAVFILDGALSMSACVIRDNRAFGIGGGLGTLASLNNACQVSLDHCQFVGNQAGIGGALLLYRTFASINESVFLGNTATNDGGAWTIQSADVASTNCLFHDNSGRSGGAIWLRSGVLGLTNSTLAGNRASINGGGLGGITMTGFASRDSIFWGNVDTNGVVESAQISAPVGSVDYSCVQGWSGALGGVGNIGDDPLFVEADGPDGVPGTGDEDFHLASNSPCIDAGDPATVYENEPEPDGGRVNMGAYGNTSEAATAGWLYIDDYVLVSKTRIGRTTFRYALQMVVRNASTTGIAQLSAELHAWPDNVTVVDGAATLGGLSAGAIVTVPDTFTIQVDRADPIDPLAISWEMQFTVAPGGGGGRTIVASVLNVDEVAGAGSGTPAVPDLSPGARVQPRPAMPPVGPQRKQE